MLLRIAMHLGFGLVILGAFLTWADNPPFSETGVERAAGLFALIASAGATVISLLDRRPRGAIIAVSAAALVLIATIVDYLDISSGRADPGTGVLLALAGTVIATGASGVYAFSLFKKPTSA